MRFPQWETSGNNLIWRAGGSLGCWEWLQVRIQKHIHTFLEFPSFEMFMWDDLAVKIFLCHFKNRPHERPLQQDHRMWRQCWQKTLCYCLNRLKRQGEKNFIKSDLPVKLFCYCSVLLLMWSHSGVVSAEEYRGGVSRESLSFELCELWPWGSAVGRGLLGWICPCVALAWKSKHCGRESKHVLLCLI